MLTTELLNHQLERTGMTTYYLWKLSGVSYSAVHDYMNGKRKIENMTYNSIERIAKNLFTHTELGLITPFHNSVDDYDRRYYNTLQSALDTPDCKIFLSGGVDYNEKNEPMQVPVHVKVNWCAMDENKFACSVRIFDNDLYGDLINNKGQKDKKQKVENWLDK